MRGIYVGSKTNPWQQKATNWLHISKVHGNDHDFPRDLNTLITREGIQTPAAVDVLVLNLPRKLNEDQLARLNDLAAYYLKPGGRFYSNKAIPEDDRFDFYSDSRITNKNLIGPWSQFDIEPATGGFSIAQRQIDPEIPRKQGLVFCHGRDHRSIPLDFLRMPVDWIYVDRDAKSHPDIVGDVFKVDLPMVDIILTQYCTARGKLNKFIRRSAQLLRPGGRLYFDVVISFFLTDYRDLYPADYEGLLGGMPGLLSEKQLAEGHPAITQYVDDRVEELLENSGFATAEYIREFPKMVRFTKAR